MALRTISAPRLLLLGYLSYVLAGWALLALPPFQQAPVGWIDTLFIATSALSTTGLVTVDPGSTFTLGGEIVILLLMQAGGLGYMTLGSVAWLALQNRLPSVRARTARAAFGLPERMRVVPFLRAVILFTLLVEAAGTLILWALFAARGLPDAFWLGLFHAVSAFCTAGFSLFPTGFEPYRADPAISITLAALSILGAMGFLIVADLWRKLRGDPRPTGLSATVILRFTLILIAGGTVLLGVVDPGIAALPTGERWLAAFFQAMTASTTVGFNTHPIGALSVPALLVLMALMLIGASPAGTGGGLKTTSLAALLGLLTAVLRGSSEVTVMGRAISPDRIRVAAAGMIYYLVLLFGAVLSLSLTETGAAFEAILFEAISAMSTIGLSTGLTGALSDPGKLLVVLLMFAGRVGILTFGIALALRRATSDGPPGERADLIL